LIQDFVIFHHFHVWFLQDYLQLEDNAKNLKISVVFLIRNKKRKLLDDILYENFFLVHIVEIIVHFVLLMIQFQFY
jgi:hypothetical protein